jgi:hypothetical protein
MTKQNPTEVASYNEKLALIESLDKLTPSVVDENPRPLVFNKIGDSKRGVFVKVADMETPDEETGELRPYKVAVFASKEPNGTIGLWTNGGTSLLSGISGAGIESGTPVMITLVDLISSGQKTTKKYAIQRLVAAKKEK